MEFWHLCWKNVQGWVWFNYFNGNICETFSQFMNLKARSAHRTLKNTQSKKMLIKNFSIFRCQLGFHHVRVIFIRFCCTCFMNLWSISLFLTFNFHSQTDMAFCGRISYLVGHKYVYDRLTVSSDSSTESFESFSFKHWSNDWNNEWWFNGLYSY